VGLAYQAAPLVISSVDAHRELATESQAVVLFPSGDAAALVAQVREVLDNHALREQLLANAALFARRRTWRSVAEQTRAVYQQAIDARGAAGAAAGHAAGRQPDETDKRRVAS
jgi:glycosyltransferase involved in cell wall biosynthesis